MADKTEWHVDKKLSLSLMLTTVSMLLYGLWFVSQQNERIALNTQAIQQNVRQISAQETRVTKALDTINMKLDRVQDILLERYQDR